MTAPELKHCPFCGGEAVALTGPVKTLWGVTCLRCACWMDDRADTADEARAAWNRRADLAAVQPAQVQSDPRDEVIARLVEAATDAAEAIDIAYGSDDDESPHRHSAKLRAALAAAKAVQHG